MDEFARLKPNEQRDYFEAAAANLGNLSAEIIQKDFWVCWTLKHLFGLNGVGEHLTFKGGTSLSKVYGVIKRFSEDIDIAIAREHLGFGGANDPENASSSKERERRLEGLKIKCQDAVKNEIIPAFLKRCAPIIGADGWSLELDPDDNDQQTILFNFPTSNTTGLVDYIRPVVKIELGARSDHWPVQQAPVQPYLVDALPDAISDKAINVKALAVERTFWEKATILHMLYHFPATKVFPVRMSRHYYDLYMLLTSPIRDAALKNVDLLTRVAEHKTIFFRAASAKYEEACQGTLRLAPPEIRKGDLKSDFAAMTSMFFDEAPDFETITASIAEFEARFNQK